MVKAFFAPKKGMDELFKLLLAILIPAMFILTIAFIIYTLKKRVFG